jgi:hypothetical protein
MLSKLNSLIARIVIGGSLCIPLNLFSPYGHAAESTENDEFFTHCGAALARTDYRPLGPILQRHSISADDCLRLNDHEFLVTADERIHFIDTQKDQVEVVAHFPSLEIHHRFLGPKGKTFVIFKSASLHHMGLVDKGYTIFFLKPGAHRESFRFQPLEGSHFLDDDSSAWNGGPPTESGCERSDDGWRIDVPQVTNGPDFSPSNSSIDFELRKLDCKSMAPIRSLVKFTWDSKKFEWKRREVIEK